MVLLNFSVSDFRRKVPKKGSDKKNLCNLIRAFRLVKNMLLKKKTPKIINKIKVPLIVSLGMAEIQDIKILVK